MDSYLLMLYVTLDQEKALKTFFWEKRWPFCKPDLSVLTDQLGRADVPDLNHTQSTLREHQGGHDSADKPVSHSKRRSNKAVQKSRDEDEKIDKNVHAEVCTTDTSPEPTSRRRSGRQSRKNKSPLSILSLTKARRKDKSEVAEELAGSFIQCDVCLGHFDSADELAIHRAQSHDMVVVKVENSILTDPHITALQQKPSNCSLEQAAVTRVSLESDDIQPEQTENGNSTDDDMGDGDDDFDDLVQDRDFIPDNKDNNMESQESVEELQPRKPLRIKSFKCSYCTKAFSQSKNLTNHIREKHHEISLYTCEHCPETFSYQTKYKIHLRSKHSEHLEAQKLHVCDFCGKTFKRSDYLKHHRDAVHLGIKRKVRKDTKAHGAPWICETCGSKFVRKGHLEEHKAMKHGDRMLNEHKCNQCSKSFARPSKLEYHINKEHNQIKPHECSDCNTKFYSQSALKKHQIFCKMSEDSMIACEQCGKRFKSQHNYKLHVQAMHSEPALVCECGQIVRWQSSVAKHKRRCPLNSDSANYLNVVRKRPIIKPKVLSAKLLDEEARIAEMNIDAGGQDIQVAADIEPESHAGDIMEDDRQTETSLASQTVVHNPPETSGYNDMEINHSTEAGTECNVSEEIFADYVTGLEEQVVEISSTLQQGSNQTAKDDSKVIYVVVRK